MNQFFKITRLYLLFLLAFEAARLYFIFYGPADFGGGPLRVFAETAWMGLRLDLSAAAYCMAPHLILLLIFQFAKSDHFLKAAVVVFITELFLIFILMLADPELYIQWGSKFNNQVLVYITHPKEMLLSAGSANWGKTFLFGLPALILFYFIGKKGISTLNKPADASWQHAVVAVLYAAGSFVLMRGGTGVATISQASAIYSANQARNAAAVNSLWNALYYVLNDTRSLYGEGFSDIPADKLQKTFQEDLKSHAMTEPLSSVEHPNILIVMLESFTASGSEFFSGRMNCMPELDRIAGEGYSFTSCYSSGDRTEKGLVSVNSGYPSQPLSSIIVFPDKVRKLPSVSSVLAGKGYHNLFVYGGDAEFASMKSYMLMHGFHEILDKQNFRKEDLNSKWGAHDGALYPFVLNKLAGTNKPFYSVVLTLSSHEPFDVPYHSGETGEKGNDRWRPFRNSLRYADSCLGAFIRACKKQAWYKNTLIVLVADHGHEIGLEDVHYFGKEKFHIPLVITGGALQDTLRGKANPFTVSQTIIPSLLLPQHRNDFAWQTAPSDSTSFAQYFYNNGFGRIQQGNELINDNASGSIYFSGDTAKRQEMIRRGRVYQQTVVEDFLQK